MNVPLPTKQYDVLYADPPWKYNFLVKPSNKLFRPQLAAANHYNVLSAKDLFDIPISTIAQSNAVLFLWVPGCIMPRGVELIKKWGFKFATVGFVWDKQRYLPGFYTMSQCEFVLVGKKGKLPTPRGARNIKQFLSERRTVHSKKPNEIRTRIQLMFPLSTRIELFARSTCPGWDAWGDQTNKFEI